MWLDGVFCLKGFILGWMVREHSLLNLIYHLIYQILVQSSSRVSEGRGLLLFLEPFFYIYSWLCMCFFFFSFPCFIPSILALQSTLSSRNLLKSHPLMISVPSFFCLRSWFYYLLYPLAFQRDIEVKGNGPCLHFSVVLSFERPSSSYNMRSR